MRHDVTELRSERLSKFLDFPQTNVAQFVPRHNLFVMTVRIEVATVGEVGGVALDILPQFLRLKIPKFT